MHQTYSLIFIYDISSNLNIPHGKNLLNATTEIRCGNLDLLNVFQYPFLIMYMCAVAFTLVTPPAYLRKTKLVSLALLFTFLSSLSAVYSYQYIEEKRAVLIALSVILWLFPLVKLNKSVISEETSISHGLPHDIVSNLISSKLRRERWRAFCYHHKMDKYRVSTSFFETKIHVYNSKLRIYSTITDSLANIINIIVLILAIYSGYMLFVNAWETDIISLTSSLTIISVLALAMVGAFLNIFSFLDNHHRYLVSILIRELRELKHVVEYAEAIQIARKIRAK